MTKNDNGPRRVRDEGLARPANGLRLMVLSVAALCAPSTAQAAPLTFDAALSLADQSAPSLAAKRADSEAASQWRMAAGRLPDPKVRLGLDNFPTSGPSAGRFGPDSQTQASIGFIQDIPSNAKRRAERQRADADIDAAKSASDVQGRNVKLNTALAWMDLFYAQKRLAALDEIDRALEPLRNNAPSQLAAGTARPAETLEVEQLTATLGDRRAELKAMVGKARAELIRWTGDEQAEPAGDAPDMSIDEKALRTALVDHPMVRAYDASGRQADADRDLAKAGKSPDWSLDLAVQRRDPAFGDMVTAGVTISLPLFGSTRQDPVIAARTQTARRVRYEREDAVRSLTAQLDADLADHVMHHDRWVRSEGTLAPLAKKRAELERSSYAAGNASLSNVLSAMLALAEAKIEALNREAEVKRDAVRITLTYGSAP